MKTLDVIQALNDAIMLKDALQPLVDSFVAGQEEVSDEEVEAAFAKLDANIDDAKAVMARLRGEAQGGAA